MRKKRISNVSILSVILGAALMSACNPGFNPLANRATPLPAALESTGVPVTGANPAVTVNDQEYSQDTVVIADVVSKGPGWLVIHNEENGSLGPPIGYTQVKDGDNKNVAVKIDPAQATVMMYAMLHTDAGTVGKYEFPGPDVPVMVNGVMVAPPFHANLHSASSITPAVVVQNQEVNAGRVTINQVTSDGPGWIAIHVQGPDGNPGAEIGYTAVQAGQNAQVTVIVDQSRITPQMFAMLHSDKGEIGSYEYPGPDVPQMANGVMVAPSFLTNTSVASAPSAAPANATVTVAIVQSSASATPAPMAAPATQTPEGMAGMATPVPTAGVAVSGGPSPAASLTTSITVADQVPVSGVVRVPRVFLTEDAWLVIHKQNPDGQMGGLVGFLRLKKGENDNVEVKIDPKQATPVLYAMLHDDFGVVGKLEFPGPDVPVMVNGAMLAPSFRYSADAASPTSAATAAAANATPTAVAGAAAAGSVAINTASSPTTPIHLVDSRGMSLYLYLSDSPGLSNCSGDCLATWKPLLAAGRLVAGDGVQASKLGVLLRPDGTRQVTYAGAPLYFYSQDANPGETKGQGFDGVWFLVTP